MRAYKFLSAGAVGLYSGFRWPTGEWVEATGPLRECGNGIHACRFLDLPYWIDDELWELELDGELLVEPRGLIARRGRLLRRLERWNLATAEEFARDCAARAHELAVGVDARGADDGDGFVARAEKYAHDVAVYSADAGADAAWAACTAYAEAYLAGFVASLGAADGTEHQAAFESTRRRQAEWLGEALEIDRKGDGPL